MAELDRLRTAFRANPSHSDTYQRLTAILPLPESAAELLRVMTVHARTLDTSQAVNVFNAAADKARELGQQSTYILCLKHALATGAASDKTFRELIHSAEHRNQHSEVLALHLDQLRQLEANTSDATEIAQAHTRVGTCYQKSFFDFRSAWKHYQLAQHADPGNLPSIKAVRKLGTELGQWKQVADSYRAELQLLNISIEAVTNRPDTASSSETNADSAHVVHLLGSLASVLASNLGDLEQAAHVLELALAYDGQSDDLAGQLAQIYTSPEWPERTHLARAGNLFAQVAMQRQRCGDKQGAITQLKRALGADPENELASTTLSQLYRSGRHWNDLTRFIRQRLSLTHDDATRGHFTV